MHCLDTTYGSSDIQAHLMMSLPTCCASQTNSRLVFGALASTSITQQQQRPSRTKYLVAHNLQWFWCLLPSAETEQCCKNADSAQCAKQHNSCYLPSCKALEGVVSLSNLIGDGVPCNLSCCVGPKTRFRLRMLCIVCTRCRELYRFAQYGCA